RAYARPQPAASASTPCWALSSANTGSPRHFTPPRAAAIDADGHHPGRSEADILEALRRRIDHRAGAAMHLEHGKAALHLPIGQQAEDAIDPGKSIGVGERRRRERRARR